MTFERVLNAYLDALARREQCRPEEEEDISLEINLLASLMEAMAQDGVQT
jgi:hypothetical protein